MILNIIHIMKELWQHGISLIHSLAIMLLTVSPEYTPIRTIDF